MSNSSKLTHVCIRQLVVHLSKGVLTRFCHRLCGSPGLTFGPNTNIGLSSCSKLETKNTKGLLLDALRRLRIRRFRLDTRNLMHHACANVAQLHRPCPHNDKLYCDPAATFARQPIWRHPPDDLRGCRERWKQAIRRSSLGTRRRLKH